VPSLGDSYENPRTGARIEVIDMSGGNLVVRRTLKPRQGRTLKHYHLDFVERFTIESGTATVKVDRSTRELGPGEEVAIQLGEAHLNPFNRGDADLVMLHAFEPATDFSREYVDAYGRLLARDNVMPSGEMPLAAAFAVQERTGAQTYSAQAPRFLQQRLVGPLGARLARRAGLLDA
jgi:mannose-6-phosphate isomerase-like protein (cupin superfamily)